MYWTMQEAFLLSLAQEERLVWNGRYPGVLDGATSAFDVEV